MPEDIKPTSDPREFKVYDPSLSTYGVTPRTATYEQSRYDTPFVIPEQDLGLTLQKMRAENQGALMELGTAAANLIPNTALSIVESAAHLADLEDWSNMIQGNAANYGNVLTEWASRNKNVFGEVYQKTPGENNIMDSAWWVSNGAGLVESVAAFGLTGYGVGSVLGKGASALSKSLNAYGKAKMGLDLAAQLGTSGTLAFTEGAMTGAQVFKDVYPDAYNTKFQEILNQGAQQYGEENLTEEYYKYADTAAKQFANQIAGEAATKAVRINTGINTFLNLPETGALFRSMSANRYLDDALKINRGENINDYLERIKSFDAAKHITKEGIKNKVKQIGGETLEEMVNVYAEQEGKNVGRKAMGKDITTLAEMLADDDIWAAGFWGAIGGSMQGFVMNKMPKWVTQEDGTTKRTTIGAYNKEQVEKKYEEQIGDLTDRLTEFVSAKDNLLKASQTNDEKLYNESINTIFKYNSFNSIVKGVEEQLIGEYENIMSLSTEQAAQQGFKGDYKQDAAKKIQSIREYTNEWNKIQDRYMSQDLDMAGYPETIFQQFVNVENNKKIITEQEFEINKLQSDINQSYALKGTDLTIAAYNDIVSSIRALDNDFELETIDLENLMNLDRFDSKTRKRIIAKLNNKYGNLENAKTQIEKNLQNIREKAKDFQRTFELQRENFDMQVDPENKLSQEEKDRMFAKILAENEFEINALTEAKSQLQRNRETLRAQEDELRQLKSKEGVQKFKDLKKQKLAEQNQNAETEVVQEQQAQAEAEREQRQEVINDIRTRQEEAPETITPKEAITLEELERAEQEELGVQGETYQEGGYTGEGSKPEELRQQYEDISKSANNTDEKGKVVDQNNNPIFVDDKLIFSFDKIAYASTIEYSEDEVSGKIKHTSLQLNPETNPDFLTTKFMPGTPIKLKKLDSNEFKPFIASRKISFKDELGRDVVVANPGETVTFEMLSHPYMQPIGIYNANGKVIGMLHDVTYIRPSRVLQQSLEEDRNNLIALRSKIGDTFIETTITGKTNGHINQLRDGFRKLNELIQNPIEFAIATSSIQLNTSKTVTVDGLINKPNYKVGQVYAITYTPNGQKIAIPVKTTQVKEHTNVMNELLAAFDKFAEDKISQNDLKEIFSKYIYSTPTSEKLDAKGKNFKREADGKDRFYIDFDSLNVNGIVFGKSGDSKKFLSVNTPKDQIESLRKAFIDILGNSYININFEKLKDTNFVKEFATSNVRFYSLPDGRVTVFDNPVISIGTSFAGEFKSIEKTEEQPRVTPIAPVSDIEKRRPIILKAISDGAEVDVTLSDGTIYNVNTTLRAYDKTAGTINAYQEGKQVEISLDNIIKVVGQNDNKVYYDAKLAIPTTPVSDIEAKNTISNGDKIISVQTKPVTDEITDTAEDLFILPDKNPEGRIHINIEPLKDILVVPNNTLTIIDKKTGKEIINKELNPEGAVIFEAMQGRLFVVANINGQLVPFYKSSAGTSGKTQGAWYPFFGYTGAWLVKGGIDKATGKMSYSPEIDRVTNLLNENLVFPDKYIDRATNSIKNTKGEVIIDMNQAFKVNRLWQKEFGSQTGTGTNYQIKGLKENTRSESGLVALITGLNTTELDSSKTQKELSEWFNLISKNAELAALEEPTTSTLGFENLGNIGNQGLAIMEDDILKKSKHVISNISKATPEQRQKIDSNIVTLQFKYPEKNITTKSWGDSLIIEVTPTIEIKPFTSNNGIEFTPGLDEDDLLPTVTEVKPGVEELFDSNPELASIGTPEQYSQYLDSIFPDSKVKDIVYHGAMEQLLPKDGKFKGYVTYFTDFKNYAETFGFPINRKIISAVINVKSPFNAQSELADVPEEIHVTDEFTNPRIIKSNTKGYDSVIGIDAGQKEGRTIAVFEPEQIHILGGKQDVEGFKKFVESGKQIEKSLSLQSKILNLINEGKITKFCK